MSNVVEMPGNPEQRERVADLERRRHEREGLEQARRAKQIRDRIAKKPRPSGQGASAERVRIAEAMFQWSERVKAAGRGGMRRVIEYISPQSSAGFLFEYTLPPTSSGDRRNNRIRRLHKEMKGYLRLAEAIAAELKISSDRVVAEVFEATSYAGPDQDLSTGLDEATVRVVRSLRLIADRVAKRHNLVNYFAELQRLNVVAVKRDASEFTDSDIPGYGSGYRPHHAWPRVDLFHTLVMESDVDIQEYGDCPRPSQMELAANPLRPNLKYMHRISLVVAPSATPDAADAMILVQPTTAVFRGGAVWQDDPFWFEGWGPMDTDYGGGGICVNAKGHEIGFDLPSDFDSSSLPPRESPDQDLAEPVPVTAQVIDRLFQVKMSSTNLQLGDYLAYWNDGATLAPKETALARLESKILYTIRVEDPSCDLEIDLDRDAARRLNVFSEWQNNMIKGAEAAWEQRFTQLKGHDGD